MSAQQLITKHLDIWTNAHKTRSIAGRGSNNKLNLHGIKKLRELILELAVRGKLVSQDADDEPASQLLTKIAVEKTKLIKEGVIKKDRAFPEIKKHDEFYELPLGWEWARLEDIGRDWGQKTPDNDFTYIDVSAIDNTLGEIVDPTILSAENAPSRARKIVVKGTVIYSTIRPYLQNIAVIENNFSPEAIASTAFAILHPLLEMPAKYFSYYLRSPAFIKYVESVQTGIAYPAINDKQFYSGVVPIPPLAEQHRIVAKVDELMAFCDQLEQTQSDNISAHAQLVEALLATLANISDHNELQNNWQRVVAHFDTLFTSEHSIDHLKQTILQLAVMGKLVPQNPNDEPASELLKKITAEKAELIKEGKIKKEKPLPKITDEKKPFELPIGWEWVYLNELFALVTDGDHQAPPKSDDGIPFLVIGNLNTRDISFDGCRYVPSEYFEKLDWGKKPTTNDVLYTVTGSYGIPIKVKSSVKFCVQRHVAIFKSLTVTPVNYILILLEAKFAFEYATQIATGIAQKTVPLTGLRKMPIPLAPLNEQHRIVTKVDELMSLCDALKTNLRNVQTTQLALADALVEQAVN